MIQHNSKGLNDNNNLKTDEVRHYYIYQIFPYYAVPSRNTPTKHVRVASRTSLLPGSTMN
jgi:hypothetical protein